MSEPIHVLVVTADPGLAGLLEPILRGPGIEVAFSEPGPFLVRVARVERPHVVVLDRVHERASTAQLEVALLKDARSDVRIILLSQEPSPADAAIVELGVFYYLAEPSPSRIAAVVEAAAASLRREAGHRPRGGVGVAASAMPAPKRPPREPESHDH